MLCIQGCGPLLVLEPSPSLAGQGSAWAGLPSVLADVPGLVSRHDPLLPAWLVGPIAIIFVVVVALRHRALGRAGLCHRARCVRSATTLLLALLTVVLSCALATIAPRQTGAFTLAWLWVACMCGGLVTLGVMEIGVAWRALQDLLAGGPAPGRTADGADANDG